MSKTGRAISTQSCARAEEREAATACGLIEQASREIVFDSGYDYGLEALALLLTTLIKPGLESFLRR